MTDEGFRKLVDLMGYLCSRSLNVCFFFLFSNFCLKFKYFVSKQQILIPRYRNLMHPHHLPRDLVSNLDIILHSGSAEGVNCYVSILQRRMYVPPFLFDCSNLFSCLRIKKTTTIDQVGFLEICNLCI